jgi:hypothetical protein
VPELELLCFWRNLEKVGAKVNFANLSRLIGFRSLLVLIAIFLEGIASLGIEVLTLRQLVPVAGSSIPVTATAIGLFLLFLAIGYYFGGKAKEDYIGKVGRNFLMAGLWSGISLSSVTTYLFFASKLPIMMQLWLYLLVCMALPVYWLGQTVPILSNLVMSERTGEASGNALFFSTMGSFLGSLLLSLVLMRYLRVSATLLAVTASLVLMGFLMFDVARLSALALLIGVLSISSNIALNVQFPSKLFAAQTAYADYRVATNAEGKTFGVNE